jgi:glucose-6-phosphate isomerase
MSGTGTLTSSTEWKALQAHYESVKTLHMRAMFADDPGRGARFSVEAAGLFDYSKNRISDEGIVMSGRVRRETGKR